MPASQKTFFLVLALVLFLNAGLSACNLFGATPTPLLPTDTPTALPTNTITLTPLPSATPSPSATATVTVTPTETNTPTPIGTPEDPYTLIDRALAQGRLDIDHVAIYRVYALFGMPSPFLPAEYNGPTLIQADGLGAYAYALQDFDKLAPATKKVLGDFLTPRQVTAAPTPNLTFTPTPLLAVALDSGTYAATVTAQDAPTETVPLTGNWDLVFEGRGLVGMFRDGKRVLTGTISGSGDQLDWVDSFGSYSCANGEPAGNYSVTLQNDTLTFTLVNDPCPRRAQLLGAQVWKKK